MKKLLGILSALMLLSAFVFADGASFDGKVTVKTSGNIGTVTTAGNSADLLGNMEAYFEVGGATDDGIAEGLFKVKLYKTTALSSLSISTNLALTSSTVDVVGVSLESYWANVVLVEDVLKLTFYSDDGWGLKSGSKIADLISWELLFTGSFKVRPLVKLSKVIKIDDNTKFSLEEMRVVDIQVNLNGANISQAPSVNWEFGWKWYFETKNAPFSQLAFYNNLWAGGGISPTLGLSWSGTRIGFVIDMDKTLSENFGLLIKLYDSFDSAFAIDIGNFSAGSTMGASFEQPLVVKATVYMDKLSVFGEFDFKGATGWGTPFANLFDAANLYGAIIVGATFKPTAPVSISPKLTIANLLASGTPGIAYELAFTYDPAAFVFAKKE